MKIVLVHNYYPVIGGGEDSVVAEELSMLETAGHEVYPFFMYTQERGVWDFVRSALSLFWNPIAYQRMLRVLREEKPDVVHCHNTFPLISPSVYWACAKEGVPIVQTLHNYRLVCANGLFLRNGEVCEACSGKVFSWPAIRYRCYRASLLGSVMLVFLQFIHRVVGTWRTKVDSYIALTEFSKSRFVKSGVIPEDKLVVKPNFIQYSRDEQRTVTKKKQAVFVGRLWPEKGGHILVEAWVAAFDKMPGLNGYELLIIGDGPERAKIEALCDGHPERYSISFRGVLSRTDVLNVLEESRFLVCPSIWYEGFPMTIVEGFAVGVAMLSAKIGSMQSIIEEDVTGVFFEAGDVADLAEKLIWSVSNEADIEQMAHNARGVFESRYTATINQVELESVYRGIIGSD